MGPCDLYDYKPPKGTESWQGMNKATGRPPKVNMATLPPLLTLHPTMGQEVIRPDSGKKEIHGKPQPLDLSYPDLDQFSIWSKLERICFIVLSCFLLWEGIGELSVGGWVSSGDD